MTAAFVVLLAGAAFFRNGVWQSNVSLYGDVVRKTPGKARVHNNLGAGYKETGAYREALQAYQAAIAVDQGYSAAYYNIGEILELMGLEREAIPYYRNYCWLAPPDRPAETKTACERVVHLSTKHARSGVE